MPVAGGARASRSRSGAPADRHHRYAGLVSRCCGLAVDLAIVAAAAGATAGLPPLVWREVTGRDAAWLSAACALAAAALPWLYFTACWWLGGRTVGALLLGLTVTRPDGARLGLVRAAARAAAGLLVAPVWLVGMLNVLFDPDRRAWHDLVFDTVVRYHVRAGAGPPG